MRILIVVSFVNPGGAQMAALRLASGLRDRGHDTRVLFLYNVAPIPSPDHPYEVLVETARPHIAGYAGISGALLRRIRRGRPDLVLTFLPLAHVVGQTSAMLAGVRRRIVSHRTPVNTISSLMRGLDALAAWLGVYTGVVAVSESVRASCGHYPKHLKARTVVVHNGLRDWRISTLTKEEARRRFGVADDAFVVVAVGRLAGQKNYPLLLRVIERLDNATALIAGDGPEREMLETMIDSRELHRKVRLLGAMPRDDIPDLLAAADVFAQTSTYEGHSNAVLEALQTSLPVVANDIPEQREVIADDGDGDVAGALVTTGNVDAWVTAIENLRDNPGAVQAARATAARRAQLFRYDAMIAGFERAFRADESG